jgi:hypothetical protein
LLKIFSLISMLLSWSLLISLYYRFCQQQLPTEMITLFKSVLNAPKTDLNVILSPKELQSSF